MPTQRASAGSAHLSRLTDQFNNLPMPLVATAGLRRAQALPVERILPSQVQAFSQAIRAKLTDRYSSFAKDYLRALVTEIRVEGDTATISGCYRSLIETMSKKKEDTDQVPSSYA